MLPVCCTQVLEGFGGRCGDVQLDGQATSRAEMDKVGGRLEVGGGRLEVRGGRPYQAVCQFWYWLENSERITER